MPVSVGKAASGHSLMLWDASWLLSGVVQARGDAVYGHADCIVDGWIVGAVSFASQQIHLDEAQWINIRVSQAHRTREDPIFLQQFLLTSDSEDVPARALELLTQHGKDALATCR